jgi:hypothetical protein
MMNVSDTPNPFENPYASPDAAPPETPSVIPDIAAPEKAIDGPDALRLEGEITAELTREATRLVGKAGRVKFILGVLAAVLFVGWIFSGEIVHLREAPRILGNAPLVRLFMLMAYVSFFPLIILGRQVYLRRARRVFRQGRFTGCASPRGIELSFHDTDEVVRVGWNFVTGGMSNGAMLILYAYPESCLILPRPAFASQADWDRFRDWMRMRKIKPIGRGYA